MKRVTGIGGVFFKSENPEKIKKCYKKHLGIKSGKYGGTFEWHHAVDKEKKGYTAWGRSMRMLIILIRANGSL